MKFVLASYGGRGDIEPAVVVGRELLRRGHDVRMAVPPNLVGFTEAAGLEAIAYGLADEMIASRKAVPAERAKWASVHRDLIAREILATSFEFGEPTDGAEIGDGVQVSITKA